MPQGTQLYYQKVLALDPFTQDFYRQFFSPGVGHCGGGLGVVPVNALGQLRAWVEEGIAPDTLLAGSTYPIGATTATSVNLTEIVRFQDLCPWPAVSRFVSGDPGLASSYECANGTGWVDFEGPAVGGYEACFGQPGWY